MVNLPAGGRRLGTHRQAAEGARKLTLKLQKHHKDNLGHYQSHTDWLPASVDNRSPGHPRFQRLLQDADRPGCGQAAASPPASPRPAPGPAQGHSWYQRHLIITVQYFSVRDAIEMQALVSLCCKITKMSISFQTVISLQSPTTEATAVIPTVACCSAVNASSLSDAPAAGQVPNPPESHRIRSEG